MSPRKRKKIGSNQPIRKAWAHTGGGRRRPGELAFDSMILLRLYAEDRALISEAAEKIGMSMSGFLRDKSVEAARGILGT